MSIISTGYLRKTAACSLAVCLTLVLVQGIFGQTSPDPQRERLLNGLRILLWSRAGSPEIVVKLRIHSGAAFDLAGKAGEMALLADLLFPDRATSDYFTDEAGGRLEVSTNYDSITITMQGRASEFERFVELMRNALLSTQLTPETVAKLRAIRIKIVQETAISPSTVADRAIASRLFGDFPYGRPSGGSAEDLGRVERGDLMYARERFLNSNNATLAIVGVDKPRAMRVLRQLLGVWRKSEQVVPTTFRQPKTPDVRTLIISGASDQTAEIRLALRGLARSDTDFTAASVLAIVAKHRLEELMPELVKKPLYVRNEAHTLPGMFIVGASVNGSNVADTIAAVRKVFDTLTKSPLTVGELERAKSEIGAEITNLQSKPESMLDEWLDADTYHLASVDDQQVALRAVSQTDIQRVATRLFPDAALASVVVGDAQKVKTALEGRLQFEVMGEISSPPPTTKPPNKPGIHANPR